MNDPTDAIAIIKAEYNNPKYEGDRPALARELVRLGALPPEPDAGIPIDSPEAQSLIGQVGKAKGALSQVAEATPAPVVPAQPVAPAIGALSRVAPQREEVDFEAMLQKYVPQDDSKSRYLALAAALSSPTQTGSFGETVNNVANAMLQQKQQQQKLRAQYAPLVMQQIAAQQTREEQNAYRLEAQMQAQEAQRQALAAQQQGRVELASLNNAAANERAAATQAAANERAAAERALRAQLAGDASQLRRDLAPSKDSSSKPLPPNALKMQQEALDAIGTSSSINADLGALEKQIETGKLKFGPVSNLINKGRNTLGASTEESRNFGSANATLERLRNESLRLNAGVQTDGDAQRAWSELIQNVNDTDFVKQRLAEIKNINKRGAELQQLKIDGIRANYGHEPLDTSAQRNVPPALNTAPAAGGGWSIKPKG
jgi:hypothetical protein